MVDIDNLKSLALKLYGRPFVQKAICDLAKDREVGIFYGEGFGKRPQILQYPADVLELAKQGATSFHVSEERWRDPLMLSTGLSRKDLDSLRSGWDLLIDIDCHFIDYSKIAADLIIKVFLHLGITNVSCKFSGNKGFHIGIPFESLPQKIGDIDTKVKFPEIPRIVAEYIKIKIRDKLGERILQLEGNFENIIQKVGKKEEEIIIEVKNEWNDSVKKLNVESFLEIDTILISSRHMFRGVYSLNEKSGLVSIPIDITKVMEFEKKMASVDNLVESSLVFLSRNSKPNDAKQLIVESYDYHLRMQMIEKPKVKEFDNFEIPKDAILADKFPPCILKGLQGIEDGKKRFLFCLINFLHGCGYAQNDLQKIILEWNTKNPLALNEGYILKQIDYHIKQNKSVPPPNCDNATYFKALNICLPDNFCKRVKNPLMYSKLKNKSLSIPSKKPKKTKAL